MDNLQLQTIIQPLMKNIYKYKSQKGKHNIILRKLAVD